MPRKVNYGVNYDEDYDAYDDYDDYGDDDYDGGGEGNGYSDGLRGKDYLSGREFRGENGMPSQLVTKVSKSALWCCPICTYDNDESSLSCEMCGVLQGSSVHPGKDASSVKSSTTIKGKETIRCSPNEKVPENFVPSSSKSNHVDPILSSSVREKDEKVPEKFASSSSKSSHENAIQSSSAWQTAEKPQILADKLDSVKLDNNGRKIKHDGPSSAYQPEKWMLNDEDRGVSNQLNLAIVGHVDSGKSTLSGRLLHLLGQISNKEMHKYEKEAKQMGKGSFAYAWAMDESVEERERGVTMTVAIAYFTSKNYRVVLLDSPGHKDFVSNMISGATQADAAVLVVDASKGSFEAGMDGMNAYGNGQTKEHAQLIRSFGVEQLIVAVNKMDAVDFSKERFDFIKLQLGSFLRSCGFKESCITWIPLSALKNQNLVDRASDDRLCSWYQGVCLLDAIDSLQPPSRDFSKPFCMPVCDVSKSHLLGQVAACGKLESGAIKNGSKVLLMPSGDVGTVRAIQRDSSPCTIARAGDSVAVTLQGIDWGNVMPGAGLCHPDFPIASATSLELKILVLDVKMPIIVGSQVEFHIHHAKQAAKVVKIISLLDPKSGKVSKSSPRLLKAKQSAVIEVALDEAVCAAEFSKCRGLGRAFLRSSGNTIAVGVVTRILE